MKYTCGLCGNPFDPQHRTLCPFCKTTIPRIQKTESYRIINLEAGMPTVEMARQRMRQGLTKGAKDHVRVIKFIHGYGSSGTGGSIRVGIRISLTKQVRSGRIKRTIFGELISKSSKEAKFIKQICPETSDDRDLNNLNEGVTFVIL